MVRKLASVAVAATIASVGLVGAAGGANASVIDPGGAGGGCTAYNVYSQQDTSTITVSYRMICGSKQYGLSLEGYSMRSGYDGTLCGKYVTAGFTNYVASASCPIWDPSGSQRFQHTAFARVNGSTEDAHSDVYYS